MRAGGTSAESLAAGASPGAAKPRAKDAAPAESGRTGANQVLSLFKIMVLGLWQTRGLRTPRPQRAAAQAPTRCFPPSSFLWGEWWRRGHFVTPEGGNSLNP